MSERTPHFEPNELEIEVVDLDAEGHVTGVRPLPGPGASRMSPRAWRLRASALATLAVLVLLVLATAGARTSLLGRLGVPTSAVVPVSHAPAPPPRLPVPIALLPAPPLAAAPQTCPEPPALSTVVVPFFGAGIGQPPVYVAGLHTTPLSLRLGGPDGKAYTEYGWLAQLEWALEPDYAGRIVVSVRNLADGLPARLRVSALETPATSAVLDPAAAGVPLRAHWSEWIGTLFLPGAGCYELDARWFSGQWRIPFAAGR